MCIESSGICRTGLEILDGALECPLPFVADRAEGPATVVEVGSGVTAVATGDIDVPAAAARCRCLRGSRVGAMTVVTGFPPDGGQVSWRTSTCPALRRAIDACCFRCNGIIGDRADRGSAGLRTQPAGPVGTVVLSWW